jgi:hypothetical protein
LIIASPSYRNSASSSIASVADFAREGNIDHAPTSAHFQSAVTARLNRRHVANKSEPRSGEIFEPVA